MLTTAYGPMPTSFSTFAQPRGLAPLNELNDRARAISHNSPWWTRSAHVLAPVWSMTLCIIWMLAATHHSKVYCGTKSPSRYRLSANGRGTGRGLGTGVGVVGGAVRLGAATSRAAGGSGDVWAGWPVAASSSLATGVQAERRVARMTNQTRRRSLAPYMTSPFYRGAAIMHRALVPALQAPANQVVTGRKRQLDGPEIRSLFT